jgi:DNA-binding SARP family transcriptional activator
MRFQMLGPLRVWDGRNWSEICAAQQRTVLALLLIEAGRPVSTDRLVHEIWGESPPRSAVSTVRGYAMRLRRVLGKGAECPVVTRPHGYELLVEDGQLDVELFDGLVESGRRHLADGRLPAAVAQLSEALQLWRGPALADVPPTPTVASEAARLEQRRLAVLDERLGAQLGLGRHADVVDELHRLVEEHPLRERSAAQFMLALYRCGRRAEALEAYRRIRTLLVTELRQEPGPELKALQQSVLVDDKHLAPPPRPAGPMVSRVVPAQLPPDVAGFTGRAEHLRELDMLLAAAGRPVICTVTGTGGVGTTALAVHWAHRVADRFTDGQLYVNLHGYASGPPVQPIEVLTRFLLALGVPGKEVPARVSDAQSMYRGLLADKRVLILLDNAVDAEQVLPLLPGTTGCLVLVTSRHQLTRLAVHNGAVGLRLDVLTPGEARSLLTDLLGADRVEAEPAAIGELASLCGHLPLALRVAAANLTTHPRRTVADYTTRLRRDPLTALEVDGDRQSAVRATFDQSYAALPPEARRLFRLLGLVPGPDVTLPAAAALADLPEAPTAALLDRLAETHLVEHPSPGRYALHDLLRRYAADHAVAEVGAADRAAALERLFEYFLRHAAGAVGQLCPQILRLPTASAIPTAVFEDHGQARQWLDAERANLVAAVRHAADYGPHPVAWRLADALRGYLYLGTHLVDWLAVATAGLAAARADDDRPGQTAAHLSLAALEFLHGRYGEAIAQYRGALELARRAGWPEGESAALGNLGAVYRTLGRLDDAADYFAQALAIDQRIGWHAGRATKLANLGLVHFGLGQLERAADYRNQALSLHRRCGSRSGEAMSLSGLADVYRALGRLDDALACITRALTLHREVGDRMSEAATSRILAAIHRDAGRPAEALEMAGTAIGLARETGERQVEAEALTVLASVHDLLGEPERAVDGHAQALALARDIGDRYTETEVLIGLATAYRHAGDPGEAQRHARDALELAREAGFRMLGERAVALVPAAVTPRVR